MDNSSLIKKYNVAGPRYTSYPTVPYWSDEGFDASSWKNSLRTFQNNSAISLYIHLPYCESLCTFCACHKRITKNHNVEEPYIDAVLKEWQLYVRLLPNRPLIEEIHLGGGTPSFFQPQLLKKLIDGILTHADRTPTYEFSFEGHPNNTTKEHLKTLFDVGFRRVSFGVQDYDPVVQKAIHRMQPFENVAHVTELARNIGYTSISHDLVFGLPFQNENSVQYTIQKTLELRPDRIAFYSYAHVPWIKGNGQRGFDENDLPSGDKKRNLYEFGRAMFEKNGYIEVGMDHFALPHDPLFKAMKHGTLHRNFMGYTTTQTQTMIGLGVSSISDSWGAFAQNLKEIDAYIEAVHAGNLPLLKGHILTPEDLFFRKQILNIICHFETKWTPEDLETYQLQDILQQLEEFQKDNLLKYNTLGVEILPAGKPFIRNICMAFDQRMLRKSPHHQLFSQTI